MPELWPPTGSLVANPGCYATAALLALGPIVEAVDPTDLVVDAKSGVSGRAGARPRAHTRDSSSRTCLRTWSGRTAMRRRSSARSDPVCFVPHLLPIRRGLLVTCYVRATHDTVRERLEDAYRESAVVRILPPGTAPDLSRVQATDAAEIGLFSDRATGMAIVVCALDNLGKGAAGQAIQSANLVLGLGETAGLRLSGVLV